MIFIYMFESVIFESDILFILIFEIYLKRIFEIYLKDANKIY